MTPPLRRAWPLLLAGLTVLGPAPAVVARPDDPDAPDVVVSTMPRGTAGDHSTKLRDVDGDGDLDLLRVDEVGVHVRLLDDDGSYGEDDDDTLPWPAGDLGWHLVDVDGDGTTEVALLLGGTRVVVYRIDAEGRFDEGTTVLEDKRGSLPRGLRRVPFVRDVDADGLPDFVLNGGGLYRIHLAAGDGQPLTVQLEADIDYRVGDPGSMTGRFAQEVFIPWFRIEDVDGRGGMDLITETDDVVQFHLELSSRPTWTLDLAALKDELPDQEIDLDNLMGSVTNRVTWRVVDIDGSPPNDLIVTQAATFRIYRDGSAGDIARPPDMVLKSSGNVLHYLLRDVEGDALPELQIIRGDVISLGEAARLLLIPGAIDFDVFTYGNDGGEISRRPTRRTTLTLEIPALVFFFQELQEMEDELKERFRTPAQRIDLDGDGQRDDVIDVVAGRCVAYLDVVTEGWADTIVERVDDTSLDGLLETFILNDLDALDDGGSFSLDLGDIKQLRLTPGFELRRLVEGLTPWFGIATPFDPVEAPEIEVVDVDRDGLDDAVIKGEQPDGQDLVMILVTRRR